MKETLKNWFRQPCIYLPIKRLQLSSKKDVLNEYLDFFWSGQEFASLAKLEEFCEKLVNTKFTTREIFASNQAYSHDFIFKIYLQMNPLEQLSVIIEHGAVFVKHLVESSLTYKAAKGMLTMSDSRKSYLQSLGIKALDVGPYIHYTKSLVSDNNIQYLKKKSGKIALYFPDHSTEYVVNISARKNLIASLERIQKEGFDTIVVCAHCYDYCSLKSILKSHNQISNTYLMTAGSKYGVHVMPMLLSLITLADKVFTNTLGTHLGYAAYCRKDLGILEKPNKNRKLKGVPKFVTNELQRHPPLDGMRERELILSDLSAIEKTEKDLNKRIKAFRDYLNPYFGFTSVKSRGEINEFLKNVL